MIGLVLLLARQENEQVSESERFGSGLRYVCGEDSGVCGGGFGKLF